MKVVCGVLILALLLCGCASPALETVSDVYEQPMPAEARQILIDLPQEAARSVMEGTDGGVLYQCVGYEIRVQTLAVDSLDEALRAVTGYGEEKLTVIKTAAGDYSRYDCVWCSAGEEGELVGRTAILDDGSFYYCVSLLSKSEDAYPLQQTWQQILGSLELG